MADRRIGVSGQRSAQEQITTDSAYTDDEFRNPGLHVYHSYLGGVDWRDWVQLTKGFPLWSIRANGPVIETRVSG
jgi:hypothetical protein